MLLSRRVIDLSSTGESVDQYMGLKDMGVITAYTAAEQINRKAATGMSSMELTGGCDNEGPAMAAQIMNMGL